MADIGKAEVSRPYVRVVHACMPVFGCFVGGVGIDKEPSGFSVHLISFRNSSETSDRGALSMPKRNL